MVQWTGIRVKRKVVQGRLGVEGHKGPYYYLAWFIGRNSAAVVGFPWELLGFETLFIEVPDVGVAKRKSHNVTRGHP